MAYTPYKAKRMKSPMAQKYQTSKSDTIRIPNNYKVGDYVSEDDFEDQFEKIEGKAETFPQYSVQDYSKVKKDKKGKFVVREK